MQRVISDHKPRVQLEIDSDTLVRLLSHRELYLEELHCLNDTSQRLVIKALAAATKVRQ